MFLGQMKKVHENEGRILSEIELPTSTGNCESMKNQMELNFRGLVHFKVSFLKNYGLPNLEQIQGWSNQFCVRVYCRYNWEW